MTKRLKKTRSALSHVDLRGPLPEMNCGIYADDLRTAPQALDKEWLVTNGVGGFASGSLALLNSRRYHGLLAASLSPPGDRVLMVAKVDPVVDYFGQTYELATNEFADGTLHPTGLSHLQSFHFEGLIPVWTFVIGDAVIEIRVWMKHGANTSYVRYTLRQASAPVTLALQPLCTYRDIHSHLRGGWEMAVEPLPHGFQIVAHDSARPYRVTCDSATFVPEGCWHWDFRHRLEASRGLDEVEDLYCPGSLILTLDPGESATLVATAEDTEHLQTETALKQAQTRQEHLIERLPSKWPEWIKRLGLAADQFIVCRAVDGKRSTTVIAGYPWFEDWGRDTLISLPGLTLATGRHKEAKSILRLFASFLSDGLIPNCFPGHDQQAAYNTVDGALWFVHALHLHGHLTKNDQLIAELFPVVEEIINRHLNGTRYHIHCDVDGLLQCGEDGVQLTWMDAKVGDWVVTPRAGKPVEINALWYNALRAAESFSKDLGYTEKQEHYRQLAQRARQGFARFWNEEEGCLYDVIDIPSDSDEACVDDSVRPNQIFALSLPFDLVSKAQAMSIIDICSRDLWTPRGLRSLSPTDPSYIGVYEGDRLHRDAAYHQGTVWAWPMGAFVRAHFKLYRDRQAALRYLEPLAHHLSEDCIGTLGEIFDGNAPHLSRGCFAQAWSVAEVLHTWQALHHPSAYLLEP